MNGTSAGNPLLRPFTFFSIVIVLGSAATIKLANAQNPVVKARPVSGESGARPIPEKLKDFPYIVRRNNDDETVKPIVYRIPESGNYMYVESDGRHVTCFEPGGKILWHRDPYNDAHMQPYRCTKPLIAHVGEYKDSDHPTDTIGITFNSSQCGRLNEKTGNFVYCGQN